jgi:uncharacterized protein YndB with AHSA1/START domain
MYSTIVWILCLCTSIACALNAEVIESRAVYEGEINAGIDAVWTAFTTKDGLESWMAPLVEVEFTVGGTIRSNYDPEGAIGDVGTIENTILSYDPKRMISLKATGFPEGFPFKDAARSTWTVFYFDAISPEKTQVTVVGLGYTDAEQSRKMKEFFSVANKQSLDSLNKSLSEREDQP